MSSILETKPVTFKEYSVVEPISKNHYPGFGLRKTWKFKGFIDTNSAQTDLYDDSGKFNPKDVVNKWIYVFRTTNYKNDDGTYTLVNKINPKDAGTVYQLPVRERFNGRLDSVYSFFCISQIELSESRVNKLRVQLNDFLFAKNNSHGKPILCTRLMWIPLIEDHERYQVIINRSKAHEIIEKDEVEYVNDNSSPVTIYLTDYKMILAKTYRNYLDEKAKFDFIMESKENYTINNVGTFAQNAQIYTITSIITKLCEVEGKEDRHKEHLNTYDDMMEWRKNIESRVEKHQKIYQTSLNILIPWIMQASFNSLLYDYSFDSDEKHEEIEGIIGDILEKICIEPQIAFFLKELLQESVGQYDKLNEEGLSINIDNITNYNSETNWFANTFFVTRYGTKGFSKILTAFTTATTKISHTLAINDFKKIFDNRFTTGAVSITETKLELYKNKYIDFDDWKAQKQKLHPNTDFMYDKKTKTVYVGTTKIDYDENKLIKCLKAGSDILDKVLFALDVMNVAIAITQLKELTARDATFKALGIGANITDLVVKILQVSSNKTLAKINIITSVIHGASSINDASHAFGMNDDDRAVAHLTVTAGYAISIAGSAMTIYAAAKAGAIGGTMLGGPIGGGIGAVVGIVGAVVIISGTFLVEYLRDSDYEIWLEHCLWGDNYLNNEEDPIYYPKWVFKPFNIWNSDINYQLLSFNRIQYDFKILDFDYKAGSIVAKDNVLNLIFEIRNLRPESKIFIDVNISDGVNYINLESNKEILSSFYGTVLCHNTYKQKNILRWCDSRECTRMDNYIHDEINYRHLDIRDEYSETFPDKDDREIIDIVKKDNIFYRNLHKKLLNFSSNTEIRFYASVKLDIYGNMTDVITHDITKKMYLWEIQS